MNKPQYYRMKINTSHRPQKSTRQSRGFTIVELLIVIVVIAILATITIVAYNGVQARAVDAQKAAILNNVQKAIESYYILNDRYPASNEMQSEADLQQFGLHQMSVVPKGGNVSWGIRLGSPGGTIVNLTYIAHPNSNGSGFQCMKPTVCRHYTLAYWSAPNNKSVVVANGQ